jgi:hypothetical protein
MQAIGGCLVSELHERQEHHQRGDLAGATSSNSAVDALSRNSRTMVSTG